MVCFKQSPIRSFRFESRNLCDHENDHSHPTIVYPLTVFVLWKGVLSSCSVKLHPSVQWWQAFPQLSLTTDHLICVRKLIMFDERPTLIDGNAESNNAHGVEWRANWSREMRGKKSLGKRLGWRKIFENVFAVVSEFSNSEFLCFGRLVHLKREKKTAQTLRLEESKLCLTVCIMIHKIRLLYSQENISGKSPRSRQSVNEWANQIHLFARCTIAGSQ